MWFIYQYNSSTSKIGISTQLCLILILPLSHTSSKQTPYPFLSAAPPQAAQATSHPLLPFIVRLHTHPFTKEFCPSYLKGSTNKKFSNPTYSHILSLYGLRTNFTNIPSSEAISHPSYLHIRIYHCLPQKIQPPPPFSKKKKTPKTYLPLNFILFLLPLRKLCFHLLPYPMHLVKDIKINALH